MYVELFLYKVTDYASMKVASKPTLQNNDNAVSPVSGGVLIIFLTFVAVATVAAVYNDSAVERINNSPINQINNSKSLIIKCRAQTITKVFQAAIH